MSTELVMYEISATSKDNQGYLLRLESEPETLEMTFNKHMEAKGWGHHQYKIKSYKEVLNDTVDG